MISLAEIASRSGVPIPQGFRPSLAPLANVTVLGGSPLAIPLDGYDPNGGPLTYTITTDNPSLLTPELQTGDHSWRVRVQDFGDMVFQFYEDKAPRATERFTTLSGDGFFDGVTFHRVFPSFVIQGGDPTGTGSGGSTLGDFDDQFSVDLQHNRTGILSMAKSLDDTNDSQFFVTEGAARSLDYNHTILGMLIEGERIREAISSVSTTTSATAPRPLTPVVISTTEIFTDPENSLMLLKAAEGASGSANVTVTVTDASGNSSSQTFAVTVAPDTENSPPFLADIPPQSTSANQVLTFPVQAIDVEGDPVFYAVQSGSSPSFTTSVTDEGLVTVTPPTDFIGNLTLRVLVAATTPVQDAAAIDLQVLQIPVVPNAPTGLDLLDIADSGFDQDDYVTNATEGGFRVSDLLPEAMIRFYADNAQLLGEFAADDTSVALTGIDISSLADGQHQIRASQVVNGAESEMSEPLTITIDRTSPAELQNAPPATGFVGTNYRFDANNVEEGTTGFRYSLVDAPDGMMINPASGLVEWIPAAGQDGAQSFTIVTTDAAGNMRSQPFTATIGSGSVVVSLRVTDLASNPIVSIANGQVFEVRGFIQDSRANPSGVANAYYDVAYDAARASFTGTSTFGADFPDDRNGNFGGSGLFDDVGGSTTASLGAGEFLLFRAQLIANQIGTITFSSNSAETRAITLADGSPLDAGSIAFGSASVQVLGTGANLSAVDDSLTVDEDSVQVRLDVLANDLLGPSSISAVVESVSATSGPGSVSLPEAGDGLIYTPAADFYGTETFSYTIRDASGATATGEVTVNVTNVNDPPVAQDVFVTVTEDETTPTFIAVITNDVIGPDPPDNPIEFVQIVSVGSAIGTVTNNTFNLSYVPAANFFGTDTFTYVLRDGAGLEDTGTVTVTVTEVNDAPTANADLVTVAQNSPQTIPAATLLANDSAGPGETSQTLRITSVAATGSGTVSLNPDGSAVIYTSAADFLGTDTFSYVITDDGTTDGAASPLTATGQVTVMVTEEGPEPPVAADDLFTVSSNSAVQTFAVLENDSSPSGGTATIAAVTQGSGGGTVAIAANNAGVTYVPAANFRGTDTFTYTITDETTQTDTATVTITVNNSPPTARDDEFTLLQTTRLDLLANDTTAPDTDETLTIQSTTTPTAGGTVSLVDDGAAVSYSPPSGFIGSDTFTYTASDGHGGTATATVTINVEPDNLPPVAFDDAFTVSAGSSANSLDVLENDTSLPDENETLTISAVGTSAAGATVTRNAANDRILYTPAAGFTGDDSFTYTISDGNGGTDSATVTVSVEAVNTPNPPHAANDTFTVNQDSQDNTFDVLTNDTLAAGANGPLRVTAVTQGNRGGTVSIGAGGADISYRPASGISGTETFAYTISDDDGGTDSAQVTVTITPPPEPTATVISGAVHVDANNNGLREARERGIAGVRILLQGTDEQGNQVNLETRSSATGEYRFTDLPAGTYTLSEEQPMFITDGRDTPGDQATAAGNDQFTIVVPATGIVSSQNLFGERGLDAWFTIFETLASYGEQGVLAAFHGTAPLWTQGSSDWNGFEVTLATDDNFSQFTLTANNGTNSQSVTLTAGNKRVLRMGEKDGMKLVRIVGRPTDLGISLSPGTGTTTVAAIEAAFAGS